jgi:hypothetical protein
MHLSTDGARESMGLHRARRHTREPARAPLAARVGHWLQGTWLGELSPHDREALFGGFGKLAGLVVVMVLFGLVRRRKRAAEAGTP